MELPSVFKFFNESYRCPNPLFCEDCKPEKWELKCGREEHCVYCNNTKVTACTTDTIKKYGWSTCSNKRADKCAMCKSYLQYTYQKDQILYKDCNFVQMHDTIESKRYVVCYQFTKTFIDGEFNETKEVFFVPRIEEQRL